MTHEPTVQVPVSLIERLLGNRTTDTWNELRALLSQPTSTAEHECTGPHGDGRPEVCVCAVGHDHRHDEQDAEPPRIEDLAPGTTLTAQTLGGIRRLRLTFHDGRLYQRDGGYFAPEDIDPSTIRDVTPAQ